MVLLKIVLMLVFSLQTTWSLTGNNICEVHEKYKINVTELVPRNLTYRHYKWCLNIPPRCSYYTRKQIVEEKIVEKETERIVKTCCPGYVENNEECILDCNECIKYCNGITACQCNGTIVCPEEVSLEFSSASKCNFSCPVDCTHSASSCLEMCNCSLISCRSLCQEDQNIQNSFRINQTQTTASIGSDTILLSPLLTDATTISSISVAATTTSLKTTTIVTNPVPNTTHTNIFVKKNNLPENFNRGNLEKIIVKVIYDRFHENGTIVGEVSERVNRTTTRRSEEKGNTNVSSEKSTLHDPRKKERDEEGSFFDAMVNTFKVDGDMEVGGSSVTTDDGRHLTTGSTGNAYGAFSFPSTNVDTNGHILFYGLITLTVALTGIGIAIGGVVAAVFIIKLKYGKKSRDSAACCKVHFTKTDNNNCSFAVNSDCPSDFRKTASPDLQHQGTLSRGSTISPVPELVDFTLKFSTNVSNICSTNENIYDEIRSKDERTESSFYVNLSDNNKFS